MPFGIGVTELVILLVALLIIFGPKRLPEMGRSLGKGMREFKDSISGKDDDDEPVHHRLATELPPADEHPVAPDQSRRAARARHRLLASGGEPMALKRLPRRLQHGEEATLVEHLGELRSRILISLLAIIPAFIVAFVFRDTLIDVLTRPLPDDKKLITFGVTEPFTTVMKVCLATAVAVTLPILLYQLWSFLAPAIEEGKQRTVAVFTLFATILFAAGVTFSYFIVLPRALGFLTNFGEEFFQVEVRASYYFSFVTLTLIASGLAFQMPIFILGLVRLRILSADRLRRNRRVGFALMVVFAVLLPTVDPVSLLLEVAPLIILFELSIQLATVMEKRWDIADQKSRWSEA